MSMISYIFTTSLSLKQDLSFLTWEQRMKKKRMALFHKSFYDVKLSNDQVLASRKSYIEMIYNDMQKEIDKYRDVQENVLKIVKINEQIWNKSMDEYLPSGA